MNKNGNSLLLLFFSAAVSTRSWIQSLLIILTASAERHMCISLDPLTFCKITDVSFNDQDSTV